MQIDNIYFMTDDKPVTISALAYFHRQSCVCHMISTVLKQTLQLNKLGKTDIDAMNENHSLV